MSRICIPDHEYAERLEKCAAIVAKKGYDIFLVNSNEADYANVRYFTNYWPLFERAGVAIAPSGKAALPSLGINPQFSARAKRRLRSAALVSLALFGACFVLSYAVCTLSAGSLQFWHVWGWFVN